MKVATIGAMSAAFAISTVGLSGSTASQQRAAAHSTATKTVPVAARSH
jgi:hypothetical protein